MSRAAGDKNAAAGRGRRCSGRTPPTGTLGKEKAVFAGFLILWIVFNGRLTLEIVLIGIVVSLLMTLLTCKMTGMKFRDAMFGRRGAFRYAPYLFRLLGEIAVCSLRVIVLVLRPKCEVKPKLFYFEPAIESEGVRVMLANSITLTPGTLTVGLKGGRFHVHALDASFSDGIETSELVRALERIDAAKSKRREARG